MQQKQNKTQKASNRISLYSKFKMWCLVHRVPVLLIPGILIAVCAIAAFLVGGVVVGWDIKAALTSPTSILAYVIISFAILGALYYFFIARRK